MHKKIRRWLTPSAFDNEDAPPLAGVMDRMGVYFVLAMAITALVYIPFFALHKLASWIVVLFMLIIYSIARILFNRGKTTQAALFLVTFGWLVCQALVFLGGGVQSPVMFSLAAITLAASLLFPRPHGTLFLYLNILSSLGFAIFGQNTPALLPAYFHYNPIGIWFVFSLSLIFIHITVSLTVGRLQDTLDATRRQARSRAETELTLQESESKFHNFVREASEGFALTDEEGAIIEWNRACEDLTGLPNEKVLGTRFWDLQAILLNPDHNLPRPDDPAVLSLQEALRTGRSNFFNRPLEARIYRMDGTQRFFRQTVFPIQTDKGYRLGFISHDITESKAIEQRLEKSEKRHRAIIESAPIPYAMNDDQGNITMVNSAFTRAFGYTQEEIPTLDLWWSLAYPDPAYREWVSDTWQARLDKARKESVEFEPMEVQVCCRDGSLRTVVANAASLVDSFSEVHLVVLYDITERKRAEEALRYLSTHDALTELFNRAYFETELNRADHSRDFPVSIVVADVDNMKVTNDSLGHIAGDELLKKVAVLLREAFRASDLIARIGGDEFAVLLMRTDEATTSQMLARVRAKLDDYNLGRPDLPIHLSLGACTSDQGGLARAFTTADKRMYADKAIRKSK